MLYEQSEQVSGLISGDSGDIVDVMLYSQTLAVTHKALLDNRCQVEVHRIEIFAS